jgi:hypothetical protein
MQEILQKAGSLQITNNQSEVKMNMSDAVYKKLEQIKAEIAEIPVLVANSQTIPDSIKQYSPNIINEKMKERTARVMQSVADLIDKKITELDALFTKTAGEYRKLRFPLSTSSSFLQVESGRYLDSHALTVVQATFASNDAGALSDEMTEASTREDIELWSWLAYWTRLIWKSSKLDEVEKISSALAMYDSFTNRNEWQVALKRIEHLKNEIRSKKALVSQPALFNPSTIREWEDSVKALGMA